MDLNEKVKLAHDDSDNEKEDDSIVWGGRSRQSREERSKVNVSNNLNSVSKEESEPKKIQSKNVWHGDYGDNLQDKQVRSAFPTLSTIQTSMEMQNNDEEVIKYKHNQRKGKSNLKEDLKAEISLSELERIKNEDKKDNIEVDDD